MTIFQAEEVLRQSGEIYTTKQDLRRISSRVYDPLIKTACEKIIVYTLWKGGKYGYK